MNRDMFAIKKLLSTQDSESDNNSVSSVIEHLLQNHSGVMSHSDTIINQIAQIANSTKLFM